MLLQRVQKKKAQEDKDAEKRALLAKAKLQESPRRTSPEPRDRSPVKPKKEFLQVKPVEEKKEVKKKPEMKDAQTQTDRSDYQRIKK